MKNWKKILPRRWRDTNITWRYFVPGHYCWSFWTDLKRLFRPHQRWVKRVIPYYRWSDKTHLIPEFLFACIIHFVEEEEAFERVVWECGEDWVTERMQAWSVERANARKELEAAYNYAKTGRKQLQALEHRALFSEDDWKTHSELKQRLDAEDIKHMQLIIKNVCYLWV